MAASDRDIEHFLSIADSPIATVITDPSLPDNPVVAVNRAFCALTGYSEDEIVGRNCRFLGGGETDSSARGTLREAVAAAKPVLSELLNYKKDGTPFQNAVMVAPILNAAGEVIYFLGSQMEVTSDVSLPSSLRRSRAEDAVRALTPRQRQVLAHMMEGLRNKQIAASLGIDEKTVKMHRAAMLIRLGAPTSADAIRVGVEAGLTADSAG